ncbi:hypothetical protein Acr_00g0007000 [Actinidia rufa]|uniref:LysM domain-containing protein n=1 Tax=Actinidia rufa TaxID=165716 RepID=A0A7J0D869_9ERIC|nr:hypothetical protein Acr_00g0007000 [Actinidia rufa]
MAKTSNNVTMFLNIVLVLSLLLILTIAESRLIPGVVVTKTRSEPNCDAVVSVESGDTCFSIRQAFNLTTDFFASLNPNLNCDTLFVGQWLCVDGTAN